MKTKWILFTLISVAILGLAGGLLYWDYKKRQKKKTKSSAIEAVFKLASSPSEMNLAKLAQISQKTPIFNKSELGNIDISKETAPIEAGLNNMIKKYEQKMQQDVQNSAAAQQAIQKQGQRAISLTRPITPSVLQDVFLSAYNKNQQFVSPDDFIYVGFGFYLTHSPTFLKFINDGFNDNSPTFRKLVGLGINTELNTILYNFPNNFSNDTLEKFKEEMVKFLEANQERLLCDQNFALSMVMKFFNIEELEKIFFFAGDLSSIDEKIRIFDDIHCAFLSIDHLEQESQGTGRVKRSIDKTITEFPQLLPISKESNQSLPGIFERIRIGNGFHVLSGFIIRHGPGDSHFYFPENLKNPFAGTWTVFANLKFTKQTSSQIIAELQNTYGKRVGFMYEKA
ncbi:hypothetical protein M153_2120007453 [Pseudoloma neurophilia]|uniref:Uncharacterized protein n=1 Tax=Pseudoloma neurophilia TaxID=146866 RepID=A0A0R0LZ33_9MICR|nr:hypothetical protein M153_2120007453 [Pseudoloma neurophilia]